MSDINKEIDQVAEQMEKSQKTPKEVLFDTIRELGPAGIRAKLPTLEKSEQALLLGALEEMSKGGPGSGKKGHKTNNPLRFEGKHVILEHAGNPKVPSEHKVTHKQTGESWYMDHEGGSTPEKHWGSHAEKEAMEEIGKRHGVKKAVAMDKDYAAKYVQGNIKDTVIQEDKADDDQDEKLVKPEAAVMNHQGTPTPGWEGQVIKGKEPMKKEEVKEIADKEADKEVKEHEDKMHVAKKKVKSGEKDKMKEGLKEMKKALEEKLGSTDAELIKGEMKKLLAEEDQDGDAPEMNEATRAKKESVPAIELGKDNKKNMTKSTLWSDENALLKAMTGGRNHHFSMDEYINEVLKEADKPAEEIKKSESGKEDLNDIIAKGGDANWDQVNTDRLLKANKEKVRGKIVKSFEDNEIAEALGLSPEEAKKILGE